MKKNIKLIGEHKSPQFGICECNARHWFDYTMQAWILVRGEYCECFLLAEEKKQ